MIWGEARRKIKRSLEKNRSDFKGLLLRQYPSFILSAHAKQLEQIPVFTFHTVTAGYLEPFLIYLAENKYRTVNADALYERHVSGDCEFEKEVVLTFDDGHKSLWTVAYPLLQRYGMTAVAFIVPGLIPGNGLGPGWGPANQHLCSWGEIQEMHLSGIIDFQSHSMYHHTIFVSPSIMGYVSTTTQFSFLKDALFPVLEDRATVQFPDGLPLGTPVYASASRFEESPRYLDSPSFRKACVDFVTRNGGPEFFRNRDWKRQLNRYANNTIREFSKEARFEDPCERWTAIKQGFRSAKHILERKLKGKVVRHLCFPWFKADSSVVELSGKEGYLTNFFGGVAPRLELSSQLPMPVPRLDPVYIWRLPGKGRKSLVEVLGKKCLRSTVGFLGVGKNGQAGFKTV